MNSDIAYWGHLIRKRARAVCEWLSLTDKENRESRVVLYYHNKYYYYGSRQKNGALFLKKQSCSQQEDWTINKIEVLSIHFTPHGGWCSRVPFQKAKDGKMYFTTVKGVEYCPSFENNQYFTLCHSITIPIYFFNGLKLPYWTSVDGPNSQVQWFFLSSATPTQLNNFRLFTRI